MVSTRVGYAGGTTPDPTYYSISDYTETVDVTYDPSRITYQELLDVFWANHSPQYPPYSTQYKSIIFYYNEEQHQQALESKARQEQAIGKQLYTEIRPAGAFYLAEDYHQKYYLRTVPEFAAEYEAIYPSLDDFVNSTAATRVNAYLGGGGTAEGLAKELKSLGLSPTSQDRLVKLASYHLGVVVCPVN